MAHPTGLGTTIKVTLLFLLLIALCQYTSTNKFQGTGNNPSPEKFKKTDCVLHDKKQYRVIAVGDGYYHLATFDRYNKGPFPIKPKELLKVPTEVSDPESDLTKTPCN